MPARFLFSALFLFLTTASAFLTPSSALSQTAAESGATIELERSFEIFLHEYWRQIRRRNATYLKSVHPKLPEEMYDFFFDATLQMMRFSDQRDVERTIECQDYKVCKIVYPQPNGSWAAQQFILHENSWRWLGQ